MMRYRVEVTGGNLGTTMVLDAPTTATSAVASITIHGLSNNHIYNVAVRAVNTASLIGEAATSGAATRIVATTPGLVTAISVTERLGGSLRLAWKPPLDSGGYNVSFYRVEFGEVGGPLSAVNQAPNTPTIQITGLAPATEYAVRVAAITAWRIGAYTAVFKTSTGPTSPPFAPVVQHFRLASPTSGELKVSLLDTGGVPASGVTFRATVQEAAGASVLISSASPVISIPDLEHGKQYTFTVVAVNSAGTSPASSPHVYAHTLSDRSSALRVVLVRSTQVLIEWDEPAPSQGFTLSGYKVRVPVRACVWLSACVMRC